MCGVTVLSAPSAAGGPSLPPACHADGRYNGRWSGQPPYVDGGAAAAPGPSSALRFVATAPSFVGEAAFLGPGELDAPQPPPTSPFVSARRRRSLSGGSDDAWEPDAGDVSDSSDGEYTSCSDAYDLGSPVREDRPPGGASDGGGGLSAGDVPGVSDGDLDDDSDALWAKRPVHLVEHPFEPRRALGAHVQRPGAPSSNPWTPLQVWKKFVPNQLLRLIVRETNSYAKYLQRCAKPTFLNESVAWPMKFLRHWKDIAKGELHVFLGLRYVFGMCSGLPLRIFWRTDSVFFNFPLVRGSMSRRRFEAISRCIHFVDSESPAAAGDDKFWKVRPLLDTLREKSLQHFQPGRNLAVDEQMQRCNNRMNPAKFCPPRKKVNGLKIWSICDSETGYMVTFRVAVHHREGHGGGAESLQYGPLSLHGQPLLEAGPGATLAG